MTIDVDWAPDFMVRSVANLLETASVRSTWFVTHRSEAIDELRRRPDLFELGIHPNFLAGSSHGKTEAEIIGHCMDIVPEAVSMRTHALVQSSRLLETVVRLSPVRVDVSLFLPGAPLLKPLIQHVASPLLIRVPYSWEDDDEMARSQPCWDPDAHLQEQGPVIFDFHPAHIYLNSKSMDGYRALKSIRPSLVEVSAGDCEPFVNTGNGTGSMFRSLIKDLQAQRSMRISDLVQPSKVSS